MSNLSTISPARLILLTISLITIPILGCSSLGLLFSSPLYVNQLVLADLNGDSDLDVYVVVTRDGEPYEHIPSYLLFNDGTGGFINSGQRFEFVHSTSAAAGDLDKDGDIDLLANEYFLTMQYRNDGSGGLLSSGWIANGDVPAPVGHLYFALADLDESGTLDIFTAGCCGGQTNDSQPLYPFDTVWLNDGTGHFQNTGQLLSKMGSNAVALGDLDGDGFQDAFVATGQSIDANLNITYDNPNTVWLNDGQGNFHDSGQRLGNQESLAVALGDLDGDGFLDAVVGNNGTDEVWLNDGKGNFTIGSQSLGDGSTQSVHLTDLEGDGDLDVFIAGELGGRVWFNDGTGQLTAGSQQINFGQSAAVTVGDLDGDGLTDLLVVGLVDYQLWRNNGSGLFTANARSNYR
jgi:hypothetical protein